jgi:DNA-binding response OmpR family regulator
MLTKTKVLAISNDQEMLDLLDKEFNNCLYELFTTETSGVALRDELDEREPDFIILDIVMPNLDGIETCLHLRQWTQTPIMMLSTWGTGEGMVRGLNLSSDSYLTEPFGIDELKARIDDTLKRTAIMRDTRPSIF